MDDKRKRKIHRYLDDGLPRQELSADELLDVAGYEDLINETRSLYQSVEAPDLSAGIMRRLKTDIHKDSAAQPMHRQTVVGLSCSLLRRVTVWLWSVRQVSLRPIYGIAAAAVIVTAILLVGGNRLFQDTTKPDAANAGGNMIFVQFRLEAPQDSMVRLAGSFSDWQPAYTLHQSVPGVWSVLVPLDQGVHDYAFHVDGAWVLDPVAPAVSDGFGGEKSRLLIVVPNGGLSI
jgi:hypothetical protein